MRFLPAHPRTAGIAIAGGLARRCEQVQCRAGRVARHTCAVAATRVPKTVKTMAKSLKIIMLAVLAAVLQVPTAAADEWQVTVGVADKVDDDYALTAGVSYLTDHRFPVELMGGYIGARQVDSGPVGPTWWAGAGLRWQGDWWFLGGGVAFVSNQSEILSSAYQFVTTAGIRHGSWLASLRHLSNASTRGRNRGETFLSIGWAF